VISQTAFHRNLVDPRQPPLGLTFDACGSLCSSLLNDCQDGLRSRPVMYPYHDRLSILSGKVMAGAGDDFRTPGN